MEWLEDPEEQIQLGLCWQYKIKSPYQWEITDDLHFPHCLWSGVYIRHNFTFISFFFMACHRKATYYQMWTIYGSAKIVRKSNSNNFDKSNNLLKYISSKNTNFLVSACKILNSLCNKLIIYLSSGLLLGRHIGLWEINHDFSWFYRLNDKFKRKKINRLNNNENNC